MEKKEEAFFIKFFFFTPLEFFDVEGFILIGFVFFFVCLGVLRVILLVERENRW